MDNGGAEKLRIWFIRNLPRIASIAVLSLVFVPMFQGCQNNEACYV